MTKVRYIVLLAVLALLGCTNPDKALERRGEAEYTVILYGCAGGNLDSYLNEKIFQLFGQGYEKDIFITALVKYSSSLQHKRACSGTRRLSLIGRSRVENERYADASFALDNPENFATFIAETKRRMPAKKYILILWNHGEEFSIFDQPLTTGSRAILYDDNRNYAPLSIFELERALALADTHFDAIVLDACRMASAEYLFQIKDYADFVVAPSHNIYGGMHYKRFAHYLAESNSLPSALSQFASSTMKHWTRYDTSEPMDISLFDMRKADVVLERLGECSRQLLALRNSLSGEELLRYHRLNKTKQRICKEFYGEEGILYFINPKSDSSVESVDILYLLSSFGEAFNHQPLKESVVEARKAFNEMQLATYSHNLSPAIGTTSLAVKWSYHHRYTFDYTREYIEKIGQEPQFTTLKSIYPYLHFDQATSWSHLLEGNMLE